jgi:hypothetical protein
LGGLKLIAQLPIAQKARNIALDAATGDVWIAYADGEKSYVQRFQSSARRTLNH